MKAANARRQSEEGRVLAEKEQLSRRNEMTVLPTCALKAASTASSASMPRRPA